MDLYRHCLEYVLSISSWKIMYILIIVGAKMGGCFSQIVFLPEGNPCEELREACVPIVNCTDALKNLQSSNTKICGWRNIEPKVCCSVVEAMPLDFECGQSNPSLLDLRTMPQQRNSSTGREQILENVNFERPSAGNIFSRKNSQSWMVALIYRPSRSKKLTICAGALISRRFILTAAHCFENRSSDPTKYEVLLGHTSHIPSPVGLPIDSIIIHEQFHPPALYNDIALVRLKNNLTYTNTIRSICLPDPVAVTSLLVGPLMTTTAGWGAAGFFGDLLETDLPIVSKTKCKDIYSRLSTIERHNFSDIDNERVICAGYENKKESCAGDSASVLFIKSPFTDLWTVLGIISSKYNCAKGIPGIYTNVIAYTDWIEKNASLK